jgi:hypothetical protein
VNELRGEKHGVRVAFAVTGFGTKIFETVTSVTFARSRSTARLERLNPKKKRMGPDGTSP